MAVETRRLTANWNNDDDDDDDEEEKEVLLWFIESLKSSRPVFSTALLFCLPTVLCNFSADTAPSMWAVVWGGYVDMINDVAPHNSQIK